MISLRGTVVIVGALDTKGVEFRFVQEILQKQGLGTLLIDVGVLEDSGMLVDITSSDVAVAAGTTIEQLRFWNDRGRAVTAMSEGIFHIVNRLVQEGKVDGIFGMGGTAGTTVVASAMKAVPIGTPKLIVSTVASGNTRPYVGVKDVTMMYSVVDIAGLNRLSRTILSNAAYALGGMVLGAASEALALDEHEQPKTTIGMTMFGVTTPCVTKVREIVEARGYDVLVFHATGAGGLAMEALIDAGFIQGIVDITTTELADELVGGIFSAGPERLEAGARAGIPQVVSVGALDMVNFGSPDTVPAQFQDRLFYQHNATTTLMRTTTLENSELGRVLAGKLNGAKGPVVLIFPLGGVSLLDRKGQPFEGNEQRAALLTSIKQNLRTDIPLIEVEQDINDEAVAEAIAEHFLRIIGSEMKR
ncbi:Tm-1-like ATP-binding domain-containing protein [Paenibacillus qinlingensis]|uniref:Tm-1-like ATP-binding domain-containing protein n=1 Tax=Paenibacillus qinlingensis TaxID=1837343 RepID=UPI0015678B2D|nr:Tm-1-like ATP-binding domain-containing protein [Paenibacillus qinlingensis]NQX58739.1 Tm-1-like ATP-binding domain-containing protein [Paenibacillus qinlingensis]